MARAQIIGRLGDCGIYVVIDGQPFLAIPPFGPQDIEPVSGHPESPFIKWGYERLVAPVEGDAAHLGALARAAFAVPVEQPLAGDGSLGQKVEET